jgi:predicted nucleotidyltransferase component of viral defense system
MEEKILTFHQREILEFISKDQFVCKNFFLTGGTALAEFYYQHRLSEDLDFFSENEVDSREVLKCVSRISNKLKPSKVSQESLNGQEVFYFNFGKTDFVKIDFACFPFEHLGKFKYYNNLRISSPLDIAVNKLHAISTRSRSRDYFDLYLCLNKIPLSVKEIIKNYRLKFDVYISPEHIATSFVKVLDAQDTPVFLENIQWKKVEKFFLDLADGEKRKIIA